MATVLGSFTPDFPTDDTADDAFFPWSKVMDDLGKEGLAVRQVYTIVVDDFVLQGARCLNDAAVGRAANRVRCKSHGQLEACEAAFSLLGAMASWTEAGFVNGSDRKEQQANADGGSVPAGDQSFDPSSGNFQSTYTQAVGDGCQKLLPLAYQQQFLYGLERIRGESTSTSSKTRIYKFVLHSGLNEGALFHDDDEGIFNEIRKISKQHVERRFATKRQKREEARSEWHGASEMPQDIYKQRISSSFELESELRKYNKDLQTRDAGNRWRLDLYSKFNEIDRIPFCEADANLHPLSMRSTLGLVPRLKDTSDASELADEMNKPEWVAHVRSILSGPILQAFKRSGVNTGVAAEQQGSFGGGGGGQQPQQQACVAGARNGGNGENCYFETRPEFPAPLNGAVQSNAAYIFKPPARVIENNDFYLMNPRERSIFLAPLPAAVDIGTAPIDETLVKMYNQLGWMQSPKLSVAVDPEQLTFSNYGPLREHMSRMMRGTRNRQTERDLYEHARRAATPQLTREIMRKGEEGLLEGLSTDIKAPTPRQDLRRELARLNDTICEWDRLARIQAARDAESARALAQHQQALAQVKTAYYTYGAERTWILLSANADQLPQGVLNLLSALDTEFQRRIEQATTERVARQTSKLTQNVPPLQLPEGHSFSRDRTKMKASRAGRVSMYSGQGFDYDPGRTRESPAGWDGLPCTPFNMLVTNFVTHMQTTGNLKGEMPIAGLWLRAKCSLAVKPGAKLFAGIVGAAQCGKSYMCEAVAATYPGRHVDEAGSKSRVQGNNGTNRVDGTVRTYDEIPEWLKPHCKDDEERQRRKMCADGPGGGVQRHNRTVKNDQTGDFEDRAIDTSHEEQLVFCANKGPLLGGSNMNPEQMNDHNSVLTRTDLWIAHAMSWNTKMPNKKVSEFMLAHPWAENDTETWRFQASVEALLETLCATTPGFEPDMTFADAQLELLDREAADMFGIPMPDPRAKLIRNTELRAFTLMSAAWALTQSPQYLHVFFPEAGTAGFHFSPFDILQLRPLLVAPSPTMFPFVWLRSLIGRRAYFDVLTVKMAVARVFGMEPSRYLNDLTQAAPNECPSTVPKKEMLARRRQVAKILQKRRTAERGSADWRGTFMLADYQLLGARNDELRRLLSVAAASDGLIAQAISQRGSQLPQIPVVPQSFELTQKLVWSRLNSSMTLFVKKPPSLAVSAAADHAEQKIIDVRQATHPRLRPCPKGGTERIAAELSANSIRQHAKDTVNDVCSLLQLEMHAYSCRTPTIPDASITDTWTSRKLKLPDSVTQSDIARCNAAFPRPGTEGVDLASLPHNQRASLAMKCEMLDHVDAFAAEPAHAKSVQRPFLQVAAADSGMMEARWNVRAATDAVEFAAESLCALDSDVAFAPGQFFAGDTTAEEEAAAMLMNITRLVVDKVGLLPEKTAYALPLMDPRRQSSTEHAKRPVFLVSRAARTENYSKYTRNLQSLLAADGQASKAPPAGTAPLSWWLAAETTTGKFATDVTQAAMEVNMPKVDRFVETPADPAKSASDLVFDIFGSSSMDTS